MWHGSHVVARDDKALQRKRSMVGVQEGPGKHSHIQPCSDLITHFFILFEGFMYTPFFLERN